jgi:hypothetical protein
VHACCWLALLALSACGPIVRGAVRPIPTDRATEQLVPRHLGEAHAPRQLPPPRVPHHPFMAPHGVSSMHVDPFTTNTYAWSGPLGHAPEVASHAMGYLGGECPTINFDREGRIITVCVQKRTPSLMLLDRESLRVIDTYPLPARRTSPLRIRKAMNDTSGGAYFYLDQLDRAVVGAADGTLQIIGVKGQGEAGRFALVERIDLSEQLRQPDGELDKITAVMPDFQGHIWFVCRNGTLGVVTRTRVVRTLVLHGEEIENSFSMAEDAAYVVSDHALYRFELDASSTPRIVWREAYDRGTARKIGQINQGSGTTPTLLGTDYVAIADNAAPRMNVLVYRRGRDVAERRVCKTAVFSPGRSATENTLIGHERSLIVENNAGYDLFLTMRGGKTSAPGLARIDVRADESGCDVIWESQEISQTTVPKLSAAAGLVYLYTKLPEAPANADAYYFTAIDFITGRTVFRVLTGTGVRYDNNWAAISLAPDGTAYVGVLNGLIRVRDTAPPGVLVRTDATDAAARPFAGTPSQPAF